MDIRKAKTTNRSPVNWLAVLVQVAEVKAETLKQQAALSPTQGAE